MIANEAKSLLKSTSVVMHAKVNNDTIITKISRFFIVFIGLKFD